MRSYDAFDPLTREQLNTLSHYFPIVKESDTKMIMEYIAPKKNYIISHEELERSHNQLEFHFDKVYNGSRFNLVKVSPKWRSMGGLTELKMRVRALVLFAEYLELSLPECSFDWKTLQKEFDEFKIPDNLHGIELIKEEMDASKWIDLAFGLNVRHGLIWTKNETFTYQNRITFQLGRFDVDWKSYYPSLQEAFERFSIEVKKQRLKTLF